MIIFQYSALGIVPGTFYNQSTEALLARMNTSAAEFVVSSAASRV
jgi:hypothetical protein